jgi:hypothetical protein
MTLRDITCWHFIASVVAAGLMLGQTATAQDLSSRRALNTATQLPVEIYRTPEAQADEPQSQVQYPTNLKLSQIELITTTELPTPRPASVPDSGMGDDPLPPYLRFQWESPNDVYQNLMFEDPLLERHGVSRHERLQPAISGARFLKQGALLPGKLILHRHKRVDSPLGWGTPSL